MPAAIQTRTLPATASGTVHVAETAAGAALAWHSGTAVEVALLDPADVRTGGFTVAGDGVLGLAAGAGELGLLIPRAPDQLLFVRVSLSGAVLEEQLLITGGDHAVQGVEWFYEFARTGRVVKTPDGYATYSALHRRWPDGIGHQGDTLKHVRPDAGHFDAWGWGCSHSGDQRLAVSGGEVGALCLSDCYPQKAIMFNHRQTLISDEPAGNCAGGYGGELGGLVSDGDAGFALTYASREGRGTWDVALVWLSPQGQLLQRTWLTTDAGDERGAKLARFDGALLAGWRSATTRFLQRLRPDGTPLAAAEAVTADFGSDDSDWQGLRNGDAVWARGTGSAIELVRVRACVP